MKTPIDSRRFAQNNKTEIESSVFSLSNPGMPPGMPPGMAILTCIMVTRGIYRRPEDRHACKIRTRKRKENEH